MSITVGAPASVRQSLYTAFLIAIENLVTGLPSNSKFPAKFRHRLAGEPQIAVSHPLPNTPSKASLPPQKGKKCNLCVRYDLLPMSQVAQLLAIPKFPVFRDTTYAAGSLTKYNL
jgi:hypothetical protein